MGPLMVFSFKKGMAGTSTGMTGLLFPAAFVVKDENVKKNTAEFSDLCVIYIMGEYEWSPC